MLTYNEISRKQELWGIDVTVQFLDGKEVVRTTTFIFNNEKQIDNELASRCANKIVGLDYDIANPPKSELTREEVEKKLKELGHIEENEYWEDLESKAVI